MRKPPKDRDLTRILAANLRQEMATLEAATGEEVTYTAFAFYVGVAAETVRKILNGTLDPQLSTLGVIAKRLKREAAELLDADYTPASATPPYPGVSGATRPRRLRVVGNDPPGEHSISKATSPATRRALSSLHPPKVVGPRSVASQPIALDRVTSKVKPSEVHARGPSPVGRR